jgi:hypothetical protein
LAAYNSHHAEQFLFGLPYLSNEKFHDPHNVSAEHDGKSEGGVQPFTPGNGCARKISIINDVRNVCRLMAGPDPAWQSDSRHESALAADSFKLRDLY